MKRKFWLVVASMAAAFGHPSLAKNDSAELRAKATVQAMAVEEKTILTHGIMPLPFNANPAPLPADAIWGAGYVAGIPRLAIPALRETDASLGVSYVFGLRKDFATPLPSGLAMAATWNPQLLRLGGQMIGAEAHAKGFNVLLAGGANLMRDPRNGRTFEYLSEDPLLTGVLVGHTIAGIQSNHIISTIKHFALNGQETGRKFADVKISDAAARESDLLAFQIGIEIGNPGSVMCAYNRVHGEQACASDYLLNKVLKQDWAYKGFVMSDWGAVPSYDAALSGLDQQSGEQLDPQVFFGDKLGNYGKSDQRYSARLDDMNRRILWAIYTNGLDKHPAVKGAEIDFKANSAVSLEIAKQSIVLLRNNRNVLPLARAAKRIAVIGGFADGGVMSGAGSSQVHGQGGAAVSIPIHAAGASSGSFAEQYHRSSPLEAIKAMAPQADVRFRDGRYISEAVTAARQAEVAIVFVTKWSGEGMDQADLTLPRGQDQLVAAVAAVNPNTVVVIESGNPVLMPWLDQTAAVVAAWYPGGRGGEAIASVLFGETNPSGRLPITFPASEADLPRPKVDGFDRFETNFSGNAPSADAQLLIDYDIEGSDLGYRWNARTGRAALFPFGYGLSYSTFAASKLEVRSNSARLTLKNTGARDGANIVQVYLTSRNGKIKRRLVGFQRVDLAAGSSTQVELPIDPRLLADWSGRGWHMPAGSYTFAVGENAEQLGSAVTVQLKRRDWKD